MMKYMRLVAIAAIVMLAVAMVAYIQFGGVAADAAPFAGAAVKVVLAVGHGSGTHIGGGYVLTAAHVVRGESDVRVKTDDGATNPAKVLWVGNDDDVALLQVDGLAADTARVDCGPLKVGREIRTVGNPLAEEFVTTYGRVSGRAGNGAVLVDLPLVPGMSGGGVFDRGGRLVGIASAVMTPGGLSMVSIGYVVPAERVCALLPRL